MEIKEIIQNKENFMDILLIGDEQESMVNKYLPFSRLFALYDEGLKSVSVVLGLDKNTAEIKNLATYEKYRNKGYASYLVNFICQKYKEEGFKSIILGTGENNKTLGFYKKLGFVEFDRVKDFFIQNYDHPIFENGVRLKDMIMMRKEL